jgi:DNA-binding HxlR family transcriptional regulator
MNGDDSPGVDGCESAAVLAAAGPCQASEVLGRVGDKWSLQVIFALGEGARRFTDLKRGIDGISQRMLTVTLHRVASWQIRIATARPPARFPSPRVSTDSATSTAESSMSARRSRCAPD